jgi:hypothetical protein
MHFTTIQMLLEFCIVATIFFIFYLSKFNKLNCHFLWSHFILCSGVSTRVVDWPKTRRWTNEKRERKTSTKEKGPITPLGTGQWQGCQVADLATIFADFGIMENLLAE